jgi:hypothetical protein
MRQVLQRADTVHRIDPQARLDIDLQRHRVQIESQRPADAFRRALAEEGYAAG